MDFLGLEIPEEIDDSLVVQHKIGRLDQGGKLGVVNAEMLTKNFKYAVVVIAALAAIITPTVDPLNMILVMGPLIILYVLGILLAKLA
jgi:Sec-independent protein secretion pathway component TatC